MWLITLKNICRYNDKEPIFNASSHVLQIQIAGRSVAVPVPVSITSIDPIAEQPPPDCSPPQIEWAYGYRGKDVRNNVHYLPTGELVYYCGCIVVMYNVSEQYQRHYTGHTSDVKCICVHPNRVVIASGQTTCHRRDRRLDFDRRDPIVTLLDIDEELNHHHTEAHIRIWDSITLATLHVLDGSKAMFEKAIAAVAFSIADGRWKSSCLHR
ncbi:hypothetical protein GCK32_017062 [Trichostrongylus colubriformis]|uniref:HELP domain-containing protein n=1 Tax=Trichostrongylus colubriformis TaxID=6319 RepID=A0AAN8FXE0_TRICO